VSETSGTQRRTDEPDLSGLAELARGLAALWDQHLGERLSGKKLRPYVCKGAFVVHRQSNKNLLCGTECRNCVRPRRCRSGSLGLGDLQLSGPRGGMKSEEGCGRYPGLRTRCRSDRLLSTKAQIRNSSLTRHPLSGDMRNCPPGEIEN
jgi:hypothetical protein